MDELYIQRKLEKSLTIEDSLDGSCNTKELKNFKEKYNNRAVIYGWVHKQSYKIYIGSATNGGKRPFEHINRVGAVSKKGKKSNKNLQNALKEGGLSSFILVIFKVLGQTANVNKLIKKFWKALKTFISRWYRHPLSIICCVLLTVFWVINIRKKLKRKCKKLINTT
jgi:hypothetical protein